MTYHPLTDEERGALWLLPVPTTDEYVFDWTLEGALEERFCSEPDETPREAGWEREVYEAVVRPVWPLALEGLEPTRRGGRYDGRQVALRMPAAVAARVEATPPGTQEAFLAALARHFERPIVGPIEPGCGCEFCRPQALFLAELDRTPRVERLRRYFAYILARHLELVLKAPTAYDRRLGAPRVAWVTPFDFGGNDHD